MPSNRAAYLTGPRVYPFQVKDALYTAPKANELVVKVAAVAINPVDYMKPQMGDLLMFWMAYPAVMGSDVAGLVTEVGRQVTRFKVGDRVVGHALSQHKGRSSSSEGGFQHYTVLLDYMSSGIPDSMSFERACVIPLGLSTAACALFQKDQLKLELPNRPNRKSTSKTVLVWGGSTSVGTNAIQLAVAAGYEVVTTASPRNFDYCRELGAKHVFDYSSPTVVKDIVAAVKAKQCAGAISMGAGSAEACMSVLSQVRGNKHIAMATFPLPEKYTLPRVAANMIPFMIRMYARGTVNGVRFGFLFGTSLVDNGVGSSMYQDYLPVALADGSFVPKPDPMIVGKGLEKVQEACDIQQRGVSARKVVVLL